MRVINRVILHCSATPDYPVDAARYDLFGVEDIRAWHVKDNGWSDIGYHYVVRRPGGEPEVGRPIGRAGAHVKGHNHGSIGVCYIGSRTPTLAQLESLQGLALEFHELYGIEAADWLGHYELYSGKTCPGFPMDMFREMLKYYLP